MYKKIDTVTFKFYNECKSYIINMAIDSVLLDVSYELGCITLYFQKSDTTSIIKRYFDFYTIGDNFDIVNLKYCDKNVLINNQLYFLYERLCDAW